MNERYFLDFRRVLSRLDFHDFNGLKASSPTGWFNPYGNAYKHRGFPIERREHAAFDFVANAKVGVAAGLCLGNPDVDAFTRLTADSHLEVIGETARNGYVVGLDTRTVFNSQNTSFLAAFAPAMFMAPGIGRFDDILASLLTQRVMRDRGYHVHIGPPFAYQQRHPHNLLDDLKAEMWGYEHVLEVSDFLDRMDDPTLGEAPLDEYVMAMCRYYYGGCATLPQQAREAGLAFLEDVESMRK